MPPKKRVEVSSEKRSDESFAHVFKSEGTPDGTIEIRDPATLKVFYDPVRQRILKALFEPMSVKELGDALDESPNRLYYHVRLLENHGLIRVAEERIVGSNVERLYGRSASRYELARDLWAEGAVLARPTATAEQEATFAKFGAWLDRSDADADAVLADPEADLEQEPTSMMITLQGRISAARSGELASRLSATAQEFLGGDAPRDEDGIPMAALIVVTATGREADQ